MTAEPMYELENDEFYKFIENYKHNVIDFCILKDNEPYSGENSHRKALSFAIRKFSESDDESSFGYDIDLAASVSISPAELLALPVPLSEKVLRRSNGTVKKIYNIRTDGGEIPYWQAFMFSPYGINETEDFIKVNSKLFNAGSDHLEVLKWSTDWAEYFDDGREWWGNLCVTVYDRLLDRYVVIMASATD